MQTMSLLRHQKIPVTPCRRVQSSNDMVYSSNHTLASTRNANYKLFLTSQQKHICKNSNSNTIDTDRIPTSTEHYEKKIVLKGWN